MLHSSQQSIFMLSVMFCVTQFFYAPLLRSLPLIFVGIFGAKTLSRPKSSLSTFFFFYLLALSVRMYVMYVTIQPQHLTRRRRSVQTRFSSDVVFTVFTLTYLRMYVCMYISECNCVRLLF